MDTYYTGHGYLLYWSWILIVLVMDTYCTGHGYLLYWSWILIILVMDTYYTGHGYLLYWSWILIILVMDTYYTGHGYLLYRSWILIMLVMDTYYTGHGYLLYWSWILIILTYYTGHGYLLYWSWILIVLVMDTYYTNSRAMDPFLSVFIWLLTTCIVLSRRQVVSLVFGVVPAASSFLTTDPSFMDSALYHTLGKQQFVVRIRSGGDARLELYETYGTPTYEITIGDAHNQRCSLRKYVTVHRVTFHGPQHPIRHHI